MKRLATAVLALAASLPAVAAPAVRAAWLHDGQSLAWEHGQERPVAAPSFEVPLGSVWKLFVHAYLQSSSAPEKPYRCEPQVRQRDEEYCCDPGGSVERDLALSRSCGPYFEPRRLGITAPAWRRFWQQHTAPAWLEQISNLQPDTRVDVSQLLQALARVPPATRAAVRPALVAVSLAHPAVLESLGSGPRFKTWSWHEGADRFGGAAGWLADGTPFWLGAPGTSRSVLQQHSPWLAQRLDAAGLAQVVPDADSVSTQPCVEVDYFNRYRIGHVIDPSGNEAGIGPMRGRHRIEFVNGNVVTVEGDGVLMLAREGPLTRVHARLALEEYVARVVDREGSGRHPAAARALAVAARSYVLQNAIEEGACRRIADDSRTQRVSPNPSSRAARAAAAFTESLVLDGGAVQYHQTKAAPGLMSWSLAVEQARQGDGYADILRRAYPAHTLSAAQAHADCVALPQASQWLAQRQRRWRAVLQPLPGYEPPEVAPQVCQLRMGAPHADRRRMIIRIREWTTREGRVALVHEKLHLDFRHHPSGDDEAFIEKLAQQLVDL